MNIDAKAREIASYLHGSTEAVTSDLAFVAAALLAVRNEALEEAAKVAENATEKLTGTYITQPYTEWVSGSDIAKALRALKTTTG